MTKERKCCTLHRLFSHKLVLLSLNFSRKQRNLMRKLNNFSSILQDAATGVEVGMRLENSLQHGTTTTTNINQFGDALLLLFRTISKFTEVEVPYSWDCKINPCHACLERLETFRVLAHDRPHWRAILVGVCCEGVMQRVIRL